jgi:hypothetical protein
MKTEVKTVLTSQTEANLEGPPALRQQPTGMRVLACDEGAAVESPLPALAFARTVENLSRLRATT